MLLNRDLIKKKHYGEIIFPLQAVMEVMQYFNNYMEIPQIKNLYEEVSTFMGSTSHKFIVILKLKDHLF